jgi:predicted nuclease of restriction endonuclease-like (RecB) superfamily
MTGLSARNLKYMRALAEAHPDYVFVQQVVARLPWGHVVRLLENVKDVTRREWYARQAIEHGWSRNVLVHEIESNLYERQGKALTNFSRTLPAEQSELAQQLIKDPYSFDFLTLGPELRERDLERGLLEHLRSLILELGKGFAFVSSQYRLDVGDQDFYLDPAVLPPASALLRGNRSENRGVQTGVCGQNEFLFVGGRRTAPSSR